MEVTRGKDKNEIRFRAKKRVAVGLLVTESLSFYRIVCLQPPVLYLLTYMECMNYFLWTERQGKIPNNKWVEGWVIEDWNEWR